MNPDDCPDCAASAKALHHGFRASCRGCAARAASRSPHFSRVRHAGRLDRQYQALLAQFGLTHEEVRQAADSDFRKTG